MSDNYQATFGAPLTRAELVADNPYVPQFEFLQESDASKGVKVGSGYWNDLPYLANSGVKIYRATLVQGGAVEPTATVLENTLGGTLVWSRSSAGVYVATLASAFPDDTKVFCSATYGNNNNDLTTDGINLAMYWGSANTVILEAVNISGARSELQCGTGASVEILVYP